jgi:hypothetical protein
MSYCDPLQAASTYADVEWNGTKWNGQNKTKYNALYPLFEIP